MISTAISDLLDSSTGVSVSELKAGMHVVAHRPLYQHHGIYIGDGKVVAYLLNTGVTIYSLDEFAEGDKVTVLVHDDAKFSPEEIVERALSREHEDHYSLVFNNCEHFANWCVTGEANSYQVREVAIAAASFAAALLLNPKAGKAARIGGGLALAALTTITAAKLLSDENDSDSLANTVCDGINSLSNTACKGIEAMGSASSDAYDTVSSLASEVADSVGELITRALK